MAFRDGVIPAASLWAGMRLWCGAFRNAGLRPGDRVVLALPPCPAFVMALLAALWEGVTLAILDPKLDAEQAALTLDAALVIGGETIPGASAHYTDTLYKGLRQGQQAWQPDECGLPPLVPTGLRPTRVPRTPDARLLLQTSGTTNAPRWIALSDANLFAVLDSHRVHLDLRQARVLCALPWHHAFGLIMDLLPALLAGADITCAPSGGRDAAHLLHLMAREQITHFSGVPLIMQRICDMPDGQSALGRLRGGVAGGAPVSARLAASLSRTRLRAGYGQTEASPGIALGEPGRWTANYLGQPLGCRTRVDAQGALHFQGPNACLGVWRDSGLERLDPNRWVCTGDLVWTQGPRLFYRGRQDAAFKLSNGRLVQAAYWESELKRRFPQLEEALLFSPDGQCLTLYVTRRAAQMLPDGECLRGTLGPLGARLEQMRELAPSEWKRQAKGDIDRRAMLAALPASHPVCAEPLRAPVCETPING